MRKVDDILLNSFLQIHDVGDDGFNGIYVDPVERKNYFFVFSWGGGWEHLSVSQRNKTPSWDIMCRMKEIFWGDDEVCDFITWNIDQIISIRDYVLEERFGV